VEENGIKGSESEKRECLRKGGQTHYRTIRRRNSVLTLKKEGRLVGEVGKQKDNMNQEGRGLGGRENTTGSWLK